MTHASPRGSRSGWMEEPDTAYTGRPPRPSRTPGRPRVMCRWPRRPCGDPAGPDAGQRFVLDPGAVLVLGRDSRCDIALANVTVSRRHAEIRPHPQGFEVADVGSLNGTLSQRPARRHRRAVATATNWRSASSDSFTATARAPDRRSPRRPRRAWPRRRSVSSACPEPGPGRGGERAGVPARPPLSPVRLGARPAPGWAPTDRLGAGTPSEALDRATRYQIRGTKQSSGRPWGVGMNVESILDLLSAHLARRHLSEEERRPVRRPGERTCMLSTRDGGRVRPDRGRAYCQPSADAGRVATRTRSGRARRSACCARLGRSSAEHRLRASPTGHVDWLQ